MKAFITVLAGDGIGPEVTREGVRVLRSVGELFGHEFHFHDALIGGAAIDHIGVPLPDSTLRACKDSAAVLLGAVGGPRWEGLPTGQRPEDGLLALRAGLGLFANIRPVRPFPALADASPLRPSVIRGVDLVVVRELTGGIYFGRKGRNASGASDLCSYSTDEVERIIRVGFRLALRRRGRVTSVDKANVLETSRLWREAAIRIHTQEFPGVHLEHMLVDNAAMQLVRRPADFDVIVTENMFGDILSDLTAAISGSLGLLPSASLATGAFGLFEPIHGSAPDIAGRGVANPYATILSAAMLLRESLALPAEAAAVEQAVTHAVSTGARTADIATGVAPVSTVRAADAVIEALPALASSRTPSGKGDAREMSFQ